MFLALFILCLKASSEENFNSSTELMYVKCLYEDDEDEKQMKKKDQSVYSDTRITNDIICLRVRITYTAHA